MPTGGRARRQPRTAGRRMDDNQGRSIMFDHRNETAKLSAADRAVGGCRGRNGAEARIRGTGQGAQHLLLGGLQLRRRARPVPSRVRRQGARRGPDLGPRRGQPPARGRDRRVGSDQRQQPVGTRDDVPGRPDPTASPGSLRAHVREHDAGVPSAVRMGDGQVGTGAARHDAALRAVQLRGQHGENLARDRRGRGLQHLSRRGHEREVRRPDLRQLEHLPHVRHRRGASVQGAHPRGIFGVHGCLQEHLQRRQAADRRSGLR